MPNLFDEIVGKHLKYPNKKILICADHELTFIELWQQVIATHNYFVKLSIKPSDRVIVSLPNSIDFVVISLALAKLKATMVPLPLATTTNNIKTAISSTSSKHVIAWHANIVDYKESISEQDHIVKNWIPVGRSTNREQALEDCIKEDHPSVHDFDAYVNSLKTTDSLTELECNKPYILTMTSGSTGAPKPISLSQKTKYLRAKSAISLYSVTENDTTLIATPMYHSLAERLMFVSLLSGGTLVVLPKFTINAWLQTILSCSITFTIAVSSQLKQLVMNKEPLVDKLKSLRCLVSSSALLDLDTKQKLIAELNCEFHECYGASEIAVATNIQFSQHGKNQTVGSPIPNAKIKILNALGDELPTEQVGEIACQTPLEFDGYYNLQSKTTESYSGHFFKTGDLGYLDKEGYLYYKGRTKEIIITGGINIYPQDIEDQCQSIPEIHQCAAIAIEDKELGEVVGLAIQLVDDKAVHDDAVKKIKRALITQLDGPQLPHFYFIFNNLPLSPIGKIDKITIAKLTNLASLEKKQSYYQLNWSA